jgi:hypothetical protein
MDDTMRIMILYREIQKAISIYEQENGEKPDAVLLGRAAERLLMSGSVQPVIHAKTVYGIPLIIGAQGGVYVAAVRFAYKEGGAI